MIYLAGPYSHPDKEIQEYRFKKLTALAGLYIQQGKVVYSPITNSHEIGKYIGETWELWKKFDTAMIKHCCDLYVFKMSGWEESVGVAAEIKLFPAEDIHYIEDMSLDEILTRIRAPHSKHSIVDRYQQ